MFTVGDDLGGFRGFCQEGGEHGGKSPFSLLSEPISTFPYFLNQFLNLHKN